MVQQGSKVLITITDKSFNLITFEIAAPRTESLEDLSLDIAFLRRLTDVNTGITYFMDSKIYKIVKVEAKIEQVSSKES